MKLNQRGLTVTDISIVLGVIAVVLLLSIKIISVKIEKRPSEGRAIDEFAALLRAQLLSPKSCSYSFGEKKIINKTVMFDEIRNSQNAPVYSINSKATNTHLLHRIELRHIDIEGQTGIMLLKVIFRDLAQNSAKKYLTYRNIIYGEFDKFGHIKTCRLGQNLSI